MKITTILMYCSNDFRWIEKCVEQASKISEEIIIPICDHYFDGTPENREILDKTYELLNNNPKVQIIEFEWSPGHPTYYWANMARIIGKEYSLPETDWILWLESDEIIDDIAFNKWIESKEYEQYDSFKLANYWYFREPIYQAKNWEDSVVLVRKELVNFDLSNPREREQCHEFLPVRKKREILGVDNLPMIHHYSWVRTKDEMLRKVKSWTHSGDRDWISQVEKEFEHDFNGSDFIHGYQYNIVENKFNLK
jgi:hypothetical protein